MDDKSACLKQIAQLKAQLKRASERQNQQESQDDLAPLLHYAHLKNDVNHALKADQTSALSLIFISVNNFSFLNEAFGDEIEKKILSKIAERMDACLGMNVYFSRKTAGEFVMVMFDHSIKNVKKNLRDILKLIANQPFDIDNDNIYLTVSMGVSRYPSDADSVDVLIKNAYNAMQSALSDGTNNYKYYTPQIGKYFHDRKELYKNLYGACERNEFYLCYQPQININTQKIIGVEAVIRWHNANIGLVYPETFIPLIERSDQIIPIGHWVLEEICKQIKIWHEIDKNLKISFNVSVKQLSKHVQSQYNVYTQLKKWIKKNNINPTCLELEITESTIFKDNHLTKRILQKIRELGVRIACDDFGMGYASFYRIKQQLFNTIKIDRSLIEGITENEIDKTIVQSILSIAKKTQINVIAEGANNIHEINMLRTLGCHIVQSFYYSKPISAKHFTKLLITRNKAS